MQISPLSSLWVSLFITIFYPIVGKLAVGHISPSMIMLTGTFLTMVIYFVYFTKHKFWSLLFDKKLILQLLAVGLFSSALPFLCAMVALIYTTPANAAILNQVEVFYSLILTYIFLKEKPTIKQLSGSALILCGVLFIMFGAGKISLQLKGDLIVVFSVWLYQVGHIFAKKLPKDLPPHFITGARAFYAFVFSIPLSFILMTINIPITLTFSWQSLVVILFMGFFYYFLGNYFWYRAIRNMDLSKATALILTYPAFTYLVSIILGYDKLTIFKTLGLALAMLGAYLINSVIRKAIK